MLQIRNRVLEAETWRLELSAREDRETRDLPAGDIIVTLDRWTHDATVLRVRGTRTGVRVAPHEDVSRLRNEHLHELSLVELEFAPFNDGRGYSQARVLRQALGFDADIRATGALGRDLLPFMERCGINAFVFETESEARAAMSDLDDIGVSYQRGAEQRETVAERRGLRSAA